MIVCQAGERGGRAGAIFIWRGPRPRGVQQYSHCRPQRSTAHRQSAAPLDTKLLEFKPIPYSPIMNKNLFNSNMFVHVLSTFKFYLLALATTCLIYCNTPITLSTFTCFYSIVNDNRHCVDSFHNTFDAYK